MTLTQKIDHYLGFFETKERRGEVIIVTKQDRPEELQEAIYSAHGDMLPHDWIYDTFHSILELMSDCKPDVVADLEGDYRSEIVDGLVDVYTSDLTEWINSSNYFAMYIDQAAREFGATENLLGLAQYLVIDEIYQEVLNMLKNNWHED